MPAQLQCLGESWDAIADHLCIIISRLGRRGTGINLSRNGGERGAGHTRHCVIDLLEQIGGKRGDKVDFDVGNLDTCFIRQVQHCI